MTNELALWLSIGAGVLAIIYGMLSARWILKQDAGNDRMQEIAAAIQEGAGAYMNRQYLTISVVGVVLFVVLGFTLDWGTAIGFSIGAVFSGLEYLPTGGIGAAQLDSYLRLPAVAACGGSWLATRQMIAAGEFDQIRRLTAEAVAAVRAIRAGT